MLRTLKRSSLSCAVLLTCMAAGSASAQYTGQNARYIRGATRNFLYNRPTVSPYLNLTTRDNYNGMPAYYTLVRPELEQRERQAAQQREAAQMQTQLNRVQQQAAQTQSQMADMMMTGRIGWSSRGMPRFGTYLNFYPGFQRIPRR